MEERLAQAGVELSIGRRGEHLATRVVFDVTAWERAYGEGTAFLLHMRNGDRYPYPVVITREKGKVLWDVTRTDLAVVGKGLAELQYWAGDTRVKSVVFSTRTAPCLDNEGPYPDAPEADWVEKVLEGVDNDHVCPPSGELSEIEVQSGATDFVEKPAEGFYGIGKVLVKGDADLIPGNIRDGVTIFGVQGDYDPTPKLTVGYATIKNNGVTTIYPSSGYKGMTRVQVTTEVPTDLVLQEKTVTPGRDAKYVSPDSGYNGLAQVKVNGDSDLIPGNIREGVNIFGVTGTYIKTEIVEEKLQNKSVTPGRSSQYIYPDTSDGYTGLYQVHVEGDSDLFPSNIREGVTIFGVTGTYSNDQKYQDKTVTPTRNGLTVTADSGYNALASVRVNGDSNLVPGKIADGETIFGVKGNYVSPMRSITVIPSPDEQVIYPTDEYYGFNEIIVAPTQGRQPLKNPATGQQILSGYEAYDAAGNVISGTAFLTGGTAVFALNASDWNGTTYTLVTNTWRVEDGQTPLMDLPFASSAVNAQRVVEAGITMPSITTSSSTDSTTGVVTYTTTIIFSAVRTPPVDVDVAVFNITEVAVTEETGEDGA